MIDNLSLWKSVEKTDPDQTKPITGKSYRGTSPKPHYIVRKATEAFGPCGIGWGFEVLEQEFIEGAPVKANHGGVFPEKIHTARIRLWYKHEGETGQVEHVGQTVLCGIRKKDSAPFTDEDAPKKSITDALIKALSMVGFAGDIFLGRFDDSKYVEDLQEEKFQEQERDDLIALIEGCSLDGLRELWKAPRIKSFRNGGSNPFWSDVEAAKDKRKAELQPDAAPSDAHENPFQEVA